MSICGRCYDEDIEVFKPNCHEDPMKIIGCGQYHCPECGAMLLSGLPHPDMCQKCIRRQHPGFDNT